MIKSYILLEKEMHLKDKIINYYHPSLPVEILMSDPVFGTLFSGDIENRPDKEQELAYEPLALRMMTVWTNFARSG